MYFIFRCGGIDYILINKVLFSLNSYLVARSTRETKEQKKGTEEEGNGKQGNKVIFSVLVKYSGLVQVIIRG